ncbi:MAG TPA: DUF1579 domain-containing protein [Planctomycetota bacterium]|nr:DUF1579 domain-containing protein [Planctomycetota bacterium]
MKRTIGVTVSLALAAGLAWAATAATTQEMPKPQKEHEFLKQFEGTWDSSISFRMTGEAEWTASKGTESNRLVGGFWLISESKGDMMGMPFTGIGQTGYDPYKKKYVSTWVDSFTPVLSVGEGTMKGNVLTTTIASTDCETGKPCTMTMTQEFKDKDTLAWSMRMNGKDGKEFECMKGESKRKK